VATTFRVVAPGSGFGHGRVIPVHQYLEARFEEPSLPAVTPSLQLENQSVRAALSELHPEYDAAKSIARNCALKVQNVNKVQMAESRLAATPRL
jgi:hypothetical protein